MQAHVRALDVDTAEMSTAVRAHGCARGQDQCNPFGIFHLPPSERTRLSPRRQASMSSARRLSKILQGLEHCTGRRDTDRIRWSSGREALLPVRVKDGNPRQVPLMRIEYTCSARPRGRPAQLCIVLLQLSHDLDRSISSLCPLSFVEMPN
ncbi:hypothetical protein EJB05_40254 [Eragrostis curvula]|uniref:Uncharacterized protein n=1 Tax=Eragrostis curvula TaxID=38414 RepID=A0A5J9TZ71_9POAL|nr:hypothetical protein EJB05_40254 [Eragrostis curvula]